MRLFISYPGRVQSMADKVAEVCRQQGHEPFVADHAPDDLVGPSGWLTEICGHIERCDAFVLCLAQESLASKYQQLEWQHAIITEKNLRIAVHNGSWDPLYRQGFPFVETAQRFRIDTVENLNPFVQAVRKLGPPEEERFQFARRLVTEAGTRLMLRYSRVNLSGRPVVLDDRKNYATEIDREVQNLLTDEIRATYPRDGIIAEEADPRLRPEIANAEFVWTIDPLDGTLNFMIGDERFCCSIGLLRHGQPYLGVILVPSRMELYTGGVGRPAERRLLLDGTVQSLRSDASVVLLGDCCALTHVNSEDENIERCFEGDFPKRLHHAVRRVWMWGCGLLALTAVARGSHHLFVQKVTYPWDVAPGLAILHSAGGFSSSWPAPTRQPWVLSAQSPGGIVATCNERLMSTFFEHFAVPGSF
jgi:fructose-1,6-bisphosphatase/inositol monophosphatase family enzyme